MKITYKDVRQAAFILLSKHSTNARSQTVMSAKSDSPERQLHSHQAN